MNKYLLGIITLALLTITNLTVASENSSEESPKEMDRRYEKLGTLQSIGVPYFDEKDFLIGYYYELDNGLTLLDPAPYIFSKNSHAVSSWNIGETLFIFAGSDILQTKPMSDVLNPLPMVIYNYTQNETRALYPMKEGYNPFDPFEKN